MEWLYCYYFQTLLPYVVDRSKFKCNFFQKIRYIQKKKIKVYPNYKYMDNFRITKNPEKSGKKYNCGKCDYHCNDKKDFSKHLSTTKHVVDNFRITKNPEKSEKEYSCVGCGRKYKYRSGLSKHKKKCFAEKMTGEEKSRLDFLEEEIIKMASKSDNTNEVLNMIKDLASNQSQVNQTLSNTLKDMIPKIGNYNNNKISINVFLNEHCKNAMNITDFVEKIKISIEDLMYTNENGYAEGISNIFLKHLTDMPPTERPFHCSDKKRLQFYVKDENKWERDKKNEKISKTIQKVSVKQIKHLKEWENRHPGYLEEADLMEEWRSMVHTMMGGGSDLKRCEEKIVKTLSNNVCVKDELMSK